MERFIPAEDIINSIKVYRKSLSYDDAFDYEIETKRILLSDKGKEKLKKQRTYTEYLVDRYKHHKKKAV
jgi:hypothetical protein